MKGKVKNNMLLLFSGGMDSTACIQYYLDIGYSINPLFIKFGQLSENQELKSALKICEYYGLRLKQLRVETENSFSTGEIFGRNLMFLANALFNVGNNLAIGLGIHSGTGYYDCSEDFARNFSKILFETTNGVVRLETPFIKWNKKQIWEYCHIKKVPIELTYSCEKGTETRCGQCLTCRDLNLLYGG